jgi:hypothetical protein
MHKAFSRVSPDKDPQTQQLKVRTSNLVSPLGQMLEVKDNQASNTELNLVPVSKVDLPILMQITK